MKWPRVLSALESRNYRLFFVGQMVSLVGTWMSQTASLWLVYHLSSSPFLLGVVGFASQAPIFFLAPIAGVLADRVNRHRLLVCTQVLSMLQSFVLAALALTGRISPAWLVALSFAQGVINGIDLPTRQALVVAFVNRREHLSNAIALNSSVFNLARLVGPAIGGFTVAAYGAGVCYVIDGFSYAAVIVSLLLMRMALPTPRTNVRHPLAELHEGFTSAFSFRPMRVLILTLATISAVGFSYSVLMPMFAHDVFGGDARVLGYLMSASGIGALLGAVYLGTRTTVRGLGTVVALGSALMGFGLLGFAFSKFLPWSLLSLGIVGLARGRDAVVAGGQAQRGVIDAEGYRLAVAGERHRIVDEYLYHGVHGHHADRQLACGMDRGLCRPSRHADRQRSRLPRRRATVLSAASWIAGGGSAHSGARRSAGAGGTEVGSRGVVRNRGTHNAFCCREPWCLAGIKRSDGAHLTF